MGKIGRNGHYKWGTRTKTVLKEVSENNRKLAADDGIARCPECGTPRGEGHVFGCPIPGWERRQQELFDKGV